MNLWFLSATALLVVQLVWQAFLSDAALSYVMHTSADSASTSHSSPQSTCTYMYMMSCIANHSLLKQAMVAVWVEKMLAHNTITIALFLGLQPAFLSGELGTRLFPNCRGFLAYPSVIPQQPYSQNVCIPTLIHTLNITHYSFPL